MNSELKQRCFSLFKELIRYLTVQSILHQPTATTAQSCLDASVMISAITTVLADPYMDFCHAPTAALRLLIDTAMGLFDGDQARVARLPLLADLLEQISLLCYRREWYARLGGCTALKLIVQHYPPVFVRQNAASFLNAFLEITSGLADEVSSGALDFASGSMDILLTVCFSGVSEQEEVKRLSELFVSRLLEHLDDAEALVRNASTRILQSIAKLTDLPLAELLRPRASVLTSMIQQRIHDFTSLSLDSKIGFMVGSGGYVLATVIGACLELLLVRDAATGTPPHDPKAVDG